MGPRLLVARLIAAVVVGCLGWVAGCGDSRRAVYPVAGVLTVEGQPVAQAMVAFHPLDQAGLPTALPVATTGSDGSFRLTTHSAGDGAPAGEYAVSVVWPNNSEPRDECEDVVLHDRFEGHYADPARSPWRVTVGTGSNEVPLRAAPPPVVVPPPRSAHS